MKWAFDQQGVCGAEKLVLLGIASHADSDGGNSFPAIRTLAWYASVDPRSIRRILRRLENAGYLSCERNQGGSAKCRKDLRPNLYELKMDAFPGAAVSVRGRTDERGRGRTDERGRGGTDVSSESPIEIPSEINPLPPEGGADGFDEVFVVYPRQVGRDKALQVWQSLKPDLVTRQQMLRAIEAWSRSTEWQRNDGQYIPRFTRWLSERRWLDVPGFTVATATRHAVQPQLELETAPAAAPSAEVRARINAILAGAGRTKKTESSHAP